MKNWNKTTKTNTMMKGVTDYIVMISSPIYVLLCSIFNWSLSYSRADTPFCNFHFTLFVSFVYIIIKIHHRGKTTILIIWFQIAFYDINFEIITIKMTIKELYMNYQIDWKISCNQALMVNVHSFWLCVLMNY